jgi:hypothetical protein
MGACTVASNAIVEGHMLLVDPSLMGRISCYKEDGFIVCKTLAKAWHSHIPPPPPDLYVELHRVHYQHLRNPLHIAQNVKIKAIHSIYYTYACDASKNPSTTTSSCPGPPRNIYNNIDI